MTNKIYGIPVKTIDNKEKTLKEYQGKVLLVVNVASECGLTPQYQGLESMYKKYKDQGLVVLGFPANEFGAQEPGNNEQIQQFCQTKFSIKFPMFSKIVVKGEGQHPLYKYLTDMKPEAVGRNDVSLFTNNGKSFKDLLESEGLVSGEEKDILWNFEKFLINREGDVVERFNPDIHPDNPIIINAIENQLKK